MAHVCPMREGPAPASRATTTQRAKTDLDSEIQDLSLACMFVVAV